VKDHALEGAEKALRISDYSFVSQSMYFYSPLVWCSEPQQTLTEVVRLEEALFGLSS